MEIREVKAKSIVTKSGLPGIDYVINPYIGCAHACGYCYARFMKRFTGHLESWGKFVDVKINAPDLIPGKGSKYQGKEILIGSVTDAYQPIERKYKLTRRILEKLIDLEPELEIITKSDLVLRDIDLLKKFKKCSVAISLSIQDEELRKDLEPLANSGERRIKALKKLKQEGIKTILFVSPILPYLTDWQDLVKKTKGFVDQYWFENFNPYAVARKKIDLFLKRNRPELVEKYQEVYSNDSYWNKEEGDIREFCDKEKVKYRVFFHHKKSA